MNTASRALRLTSNQTSVDTEESVDPRRPLAPGDQWRERGNGLGEQLTELAVHERRRAEDVGDPLPAVHGAERRDVQALRAGHELVRAAPSSTRRLRVAVWRLQAMERYSGKRQTLCGGAVP